MAPSRPNRHSGPSREAVRGKTSARGDRAIGKKEQKCTESRRHRRRRQRRREAPFRIESLSTPQVPPAPPSGPARMEAPAGARAAAAAAGWTDLLRSGLRAHDRKADGQIEQQQEARPRPKNGTRGRERRASKSDAVEWPARPEDREGRPKNPTTHPTSRSTRSRCDIAREIDPQRRVRLLDTLKIEGERNSIHTAALYVQARSRSTRCQALIGPTRAGFKHTPSTRYIGEFERMLEGSRAHDRGQVVARTISSSEEPARSTAPGARSRRFD